jgi:hypothetical protein
MAAKENNNSISEIPSVQATAALPEEELQDKNARFLDTMASAMPWVISLLFHVGIFLVMIFIMFIVITPSSTDEIIIPEVATIERSSGRFTPFNTIIPKPTPRPTIRKPVPQEEVSIDMGTTAKPLVIGVDGGDTVVGPMGLIASPHGRARFFPPGTGDGTGSGSADNIVFVIDRSGSMLDTFGPVRAEMLRTISRLSNTQMFHIILFAEGRPLEPDHKRLIPALRRNKKAASRFLSDISAEGQTNPVPALQRAFRVLKVARKKGRLIYLLTDGVFPDNEAVLRTIAHENRDKKVHINTYLYGTAPPEAVSVMTRIARDNGGRYRFVPHED